MIGSSGNTERSLAMVFNGSRLGIGYHSMALGMSLVVRPTLGSDIDGFAARLVLGASTSNMAAQEDPRRAFVISFLREVLSMSAREVAKVQALLSSIDGGAVIGEHNGEGSHDIGLFEADLGVSVGLNQQYIVMDDRRGRVPLHVVEEEEGGFGYQARVVTVAIELADKHDASGLGTVAAGKEFFGDWRSNLEVLPDGNQEVLQL
ncbi:hypothetical protein NE237_002078 [Protea cynaroides]|uniref:Uncharacterized protein n=1 Tax=Protea cynaroides TaxID=273540 RepID=A0A9Q0KUA6_9MAGN|nr:hypothetical protein NE237_002078 [Protea cynaroides]